MTKSELEAKVIALEAQVAMLADMVAKMSRPQVQWPNPLQPMPYRPSTAPWTPPYPVTCGGSTLSKAIGGQLYN